jgi:uncharacterized LabA/DUF88 family protein
MSRVAVFIDGAYLDYVLRDEFPEARIDYGKLSERLTAGIELLRTYYYHCLPYQSPSPTPEEALRFSRRQKFYHALSRLPRYQVRLGKLQCLGNDQNGCPIFQQKRVDILLGVDLVVLSTKAQITYAVLVAGDTDFLPAVACAKDHGVLVHLWHGTVHRPHRELWDVADDRTPLSPGVIGSIRR